MPLCSRRSSPAGGRPADRPAAGQAMSYDPGPMKMWSRAKSWPFCACPFLLALPNWPTSGRRLTGPNQAASRRQARGQSERAKRSSIIFFILFRCFGPWKLGGTLGVASRADCGRAPLRPHVVRATRAKWARLEMDAPRLSLVSSAATAAGPRGGARQVSRAAAGRKLISPSPFLFLFLSLACAHARLLLAFGEISKLASGI